MRETPDPGSSKREYFRATGIVYLHVGRRSEQSEGDRKNQHIPKSNLDPIALKLLNFRSQLQYNTPQSYEYFQSLTDIVEQMHDAILDQTGQILTSCLAKRQSVVLSGSGIEFITSEHYEPKEQLILAITFTGYPFETLTLIGEVIQEKPHGEDPKKHRTCVAFVNISEADCQVLIKHVNYLQRKHILEEKKNSYGDSNPPE